MPLKRIPVPISIDLEADGTRIRLDWPGGGVTRHSAFDLRAECPCAGCVDEVTGRRTITPDMIDADVRAVSFGRIGRYAIRFQFSDGHDTGIYAYERLRGDAP